MKVTVAEQDGLKHKLQVEVPLSDVQSTYDEVYQRLRTNIRVDGFRPGKYPRHLAEKRFQSVMAGEAMQSLVPKYFDEALTELKLRPATEPRFDNLEIDKQRPFRFEVEFEVVPSFDLLPPSAFKLTGQKVKVTPQDVAARIEELRMARAVPEDKAKQPAAAGDVVTFDFQGTRDGEPFEGGSGENQRIEVGAGQYLPDFDAQFTGIKAGQRKAFDLTFPADYGEASLAGQEVHFEVTVRQVERKAPAELNADFFKHFGDLETQEAFEARIKEQIEAERERETVQAHAEQLADQMREQYDFAVPATLVEQGLHEFEHQLSHDDPEAQHDAEKLAELKASQRPEIEANLRVAYAIDALARDYKVEADAEEVRQRFFLQAYMMRQNPTELAQTPTGRRMLMQIEQNMVTAKALERLSGEVLSAKPTAGAGKAASAKAGGGKPAGEKAPATKGGAAKATPRRAADKDAPGAKPKRTRGASAKP